jgi:hypothetical protein
MMKTSKIYRMLSLIEHCPDILNILAKLEQKYNRDLSDRGTYLSFIDYSWSERHLTDTAKDFIRYCYSK